MSTVTKGVLIGIVICLIIGLILCLLCVRTVKTGYTGILTTFGKVEDETMSAGVHWIAPWQRIVKLDNRTQKVEVSTQTFSSDIQQVDLKMSVNYCIDQSTAQNLYRTVGEEYFNTVVYPRILEITKSVFAHYTAEDLIANRQTLSGEIQTRLSKDVSEYGITIISFAVEDIDFTDAFTNAVEQKQVAAQNKLTAETEQERLTMEQQAKAEREVIDANAAAEVAKIQAEADLEVTKIQADAAEYAGLKEAAKNKAISEWLTDKLIRYYYILQWDGKLPHYYLGGNSDLLLTVPAE
ncbi:MAG: prohibitin family protein [Clostridia bacterium]|nr:prohibitin family protein [Clostridia bacterium]